MADPFGYFSFQPVAHDLCNKDRGMCYPVCGGDAYKRTLAANQKAFAHGAMGRRIDPLWWTHFSYLSFQPVSHDWCNKGRGMCYPVCGVIHIKELVLLIRKSSLCGGSGFPLSLSEWFFTICLTPYNRK